MITNIYIEQIPEVGDFITVDKWIHNNDNSYRGDCLEVLAVDENLVSVIRHHSVIAPGEWDRITLNLDLVLIRELSKEFVASIIVGETT